VLDLKLLSLFFLQILVVGDFRDEIGNDVTVLLADFVVGGVRILDDIVKKRRDDYVDIIDLADADEGRRNLDAMPYVRPPGSSLSPLILMYARRKFGRFQDCDRI